MDFTLSPKIDDFRKRIRVFVEDKLLPLETDPASFDDHENITEDLLEAKRTEARG